MMRKLTKQRLIVFIIILIFGASPLAYVITSVSNPVQQEEEFTLPEAFVIDYELNNSIEYIIRGYTILNFYYSDQADPLFSYVDQLPDMFMTDNNLKQLIVSKLPANSTYVYISGYFGEEEVTNLTEENIFDSLCRNLLAPPLECGLKQINYTG